MNRTLNRQWWSSSKSTKVIEKTRLKELDVRQEADYENFVPNHRFEDEPIGHNMVTLRAGVRQKRLTPKRFHR